jgi:SAM-dependent MidA family methyltransferase
VLGFTHQGSFLLANGLLGFASGQHTIEQQLLLSQQIQKLTLPHEMGELFKIMALGKNYSATLQGFALRDHRHRL